VDTNLARGLDFWKENHPQMSRFQMMFPCEMVSRFEPHIYMDREVDGLMDWLGG
jgi:hypothetical protein